MNKILFVLPDDLLKNQPLDNELTYLNWRSLFQISQGRLLLGKLRGMMWIIGLFNYFCEVCPLFSLLLILKGLFLLSD